MFHFTDDGHLHDEADVLLAFLLNSTEDFHDTIDNGSISSSESNQSLEFGVDEIPGLTWHNDCETSIIEVNFRYISKLKYISENSDLVADEIQRLWPDMEVVRMRDCQTETKYKVKEAAIKASEIMTEVGLKSGMNTLGTLFRNIVLNTEGFLMFFVKNWPKNQIEAIKEQSKQFLNFVSKEFFKE